MSERVWVLGLAELPPGKMAYVEVDGLPIALANVGGAVYAFGDSCRHEGGPLSAGLLIGDTVTCPWHGWTYSVRTGKSIVPPVGLRLPTYPVASRTARSTSRSTGAPEPSAPPPTIQHSTFKNSQLKIDIP